MPRAAATEVTWTVEGEPLLTDEAVQEAVAVAAQHGHRPGLVLSVVFVSADELTRLHQAYLDDGTETDVITFDLGEEGGDPEVGEPGPAGELYVSVDRARSLATRRGVALERELTLYVVHGTLHLSGFDDHDEADRQRMRAAEAHVMEQLGFPPDLGAHESGLG